MANPKRSNGSKRRRGRPPVDGLTHAQLRTFNAIRSLIALRGNVPTIRELSAELGVTPGSVQGHISQLVRKGYVRRNPRKARSLELTSNPAQDDPAQLVPVKIVGSVAAGRPILAAQNVVGQVLVESRIAGRGHCFGLEVKGDSMTGAGIKDGDLCIVRQQPIAENGEIVVALIGEEATVKRLHISDSGVELRPENPRHRPIPIAPDEDFRVVGKVVAVGQWSMMGGGLR